MSLEQVTAFAVTVYEHGYREKISSSRSSEAVKAMMVCIVLMILFI
jgi:hypothetical protein